MMLYRSLAKQPINKFPVFRRTAQFLTLLLLFVVHGEHALIAESVHGTFLSDIAARRFWEDFLSERFADDYATFVEVKSCSSGDESIYNGVILHKSGCFIVEFIDHSSLSRRFLVSRDGLWSNIEKKFDNQGKFLPDLQYGPNDLLLPIICIDCPAYCGPKKVCGRMTQQFMTTVPVEYQSDGIVFVRFSVDGAFHQPLQIEYLDKNKHVVRYQKLVRLKKCGSGWMPKVLEFVDVRTKKRVTITLSNFSTDMVLDEKFFSGDFLENHSFMHCKGYRTSFIFSGCARRLLLRSSGRYQSCTF